MNTAMSRTSAQTIPAQPRAKVALASAIATGFRVVRTNNTDRDPAIDVVANAAAPLDADGRSPFGRYIQSRDEADILLREGVVPAWFNLRRLPAAWIAEMIDPLFIIAQQRIMAVRAGCPRVDDPDGPIEITQPADVKPGSRFPALEHKHGVVLAPVEWVQELADRYGSETVQEMGQVILDHSRLPKGRRGPFSFWGGTVATL